MLCAGVFFVVCDSMNQLSLQTMHDLECFINLCVCSAGNLACAISQPSTLLQPRLQGRLRVRRKSRLRSHREVDKKRLCGATWRALRPQRVACLLFFRLFTRPFQSWMNLAIPLFRRQLPLHVKP